jgi:hypothetical protein
VLATEGMANSFSFPPMKTTEIVEALHMRLLVVNPTWFNWICPRSWLSLLPSIDVVLDSMF